MASNLFTQSLGSGPNLVLIHGWGVHSGFWQPLVEQLAGDFCITTIDLPGCGRSPLDTDHDYSLEKIAEKLVQATPKNAIWLGWSLGGLIATYIAANYPEKVAKLICVASTPKFIKAPGWPGIKSSLLEKLQATIESTSEETLVRFLSLQFKNALINRRDRQKMRNELFQYGIPHLTALQGGLEIIRNTDLRELLTTISCPTLYILGKLDVLVPMNIATKLDQLLASGYTQVLSRGCHAPFLSSTPAFMQAFHEFAKYNLHQPLELV